MTRCCFVVAGIFPIEAGEMFAVKDKAELFVHLPLPALVASPRVAASLVIAHNTKIEMLDAKRDVGTNAINFAIRTQLPQSTPYVALLVDCETEQLQTMIQGSAMHTAQVRPQWPPSRCLLRALVSVGMVQMHSMYPATPLALVEPFISRALEVDAELGFSPVPGLLYAALVHGELSPEGAST